MSWPTSSQSVSHRRFHECVNNKKKLTFNSFSFFQASIWLGVNKVLQKLTKSYKSGGVGGGADLWSPHYCLPPFQIFRPSYGPVILYYNHYYCVRIVKSCHFFFLFYMYVVCNFSLLISQSQSQLSKIYFSICKQ